MKVLGEGFYFFREPTGQVRIWHDCKQYKDRDSARVEMKEMKNGTYVCPHCELQYKLTDIDRARIG